MKFKVTANIPVEFEVLCKSKEGAIDAIKEVFKYYSDEDDYSVLMVECISAALTNFNNGQIKYEAEEVTSDD